MIEFLFGGTLHSDGELFFLQSNGIIIAALIGAVMCLGLLLYKRSGKKYWFEEAFLFFCALSILVFVISDPQWISQSGSSATGKFAVVIDNSDYSFEATINIVKNIIFSKIPNLENKI